MNNIEIDTVSKCLKKDNITIYYDGDFLLHEGIFSNRISTSLSLKQHKYYIPSNDFRSCAVDSVIMDIHLLFDFFIFINRFLNDKLINVCYVPPKFTFEDYSYVSLPKSSNVKFKLTNMKNIMDMIISTDIGINIINVDITDLNRLYKIMDLYPSVFCNHTHLQFIE